MLTGWGITDLVCRSTVILTIGWSWTILLKQFPVFRRIVLQWVFLSLAILPLTVLLPKFTWEIPGSFEGLKGHESWVRPSAETVSPTSLLTQSDTSAAARATVPQFVPSKADTPLGKSRESATQTGRVEVKTSSTSESRPPVSFTGSAVKAEGRRLLVASVVCYGIVVLLLWGRLIWEWRTVHLLSSGLRPCQSEEWLQIVEEFRKQLGIHSRIDVQRTEQSTTPLTYGWLHPVLLLPETVLAGSTTRQTRMIVLHELIHVQGNDFAWLIAVRMVQSLYWIHPASWLLGRSFAETLEEVCDGMCALEFGTQAYSETLIEVTRMVQRPVRDTLGVAMSRPSRLSLRLQRIQLHGGLVMSRLSTASMAMLMLVVVPVMAMTLFVQPVRAQSVIDKPDLETKSSRRPESTLLNPRANKLAVDSTASAPEAELKKSLPPRAFLELQDEQGRCLGLTAARVRRVRWVQGRLTFDSTWSELTTDTAGRMTVSVPDMTGINENIILDIEVAGRAPQMDGFKVHHQLEPTVPDLVRMRAGTQLTTRIFDADGKPISDARVSLLADIEPDGSDVWHHLRMSDKEGRLEICVPGNAVFGLIVVSERGAPFRRVYPASTNQLQEIHLQRGCVVSGQLLDRSGRPVPNCEVTLEEEDSQAVSTEFEVKRHGGGALDLTFQQQTDATGRFRFLPMTGNIRVYLECREGADPPQIILPVSLKLPSVGEKWLPLMLAPTGQISGHILRPDGSPIANQTLELLVPPQLSLSYITLQTTRTDASGHYSLHVPFPLEMAQIGAGRARGSDGKLWEIQPTTPSRGTNRQWKVVERYLGEPWTVNWMMVAPADRSQDNAVLESSDVLPEWQSLAQLEQEIEQARQRYLAAPAGEARDELDPRLRMVDRCLEFETDHRGTRQGLGALHFVMRAAATSTRRQLTAARDKAIDVLDQHYTKHPDVDLMIDEFDAGNGATNPEGLLLHLAEHSPFDYVRATALYELAEHQIQLAYQKVVMHQMLLSPEAEFEALLKIQSSDSSRVWLREQRLQALEMQAALKGVDLEALRAGAVELLDRVVNNYPGVAAPRRRWQNTRGLHEHSELMLVDSPESDARRTISERAEMLRFRQTRLRNGMAAPEIEGLDFYQRTIRLSQYRGQVVLLAVGLGNSDQILCVKCVQLLKRFKGQPVQCLSVISGSGSGGYSVRSIIEDSKITWPIIRDSSEDDIAERWCQYTSPEIYLIDRQGIIRDHLSEDNSSIEVLVNKVESLLKLED